MSPFINPGIVVLSNPLLLDTFNVVRRVETVNNSGESVQSLSASVGVYGVVKSIGDRLDRKAEEDSSQKDLRIFTKFALRGESRDGVPTDWKPDLIFWHGNNFIVKNVRDWGSYGIGYVAAECNSIELVSMPPQVNSGLGNSGTLSPFVPPMNPVTDRIQAFVPTIINSTQATMPVTVQSAANMVLFKNGLLKISPDQFSISSPGTQSPQVITFTTPLDPSDSIIFYA
jgi:galactose-6-phosphate isomerase